MSHLISRKVSNLPLFVSINNFKCIDSETMMINNVTNINKMNDHISPLNTKQGNDKLHWKSSSVLWQRTKMWRAKSYFSIVYTNLRSKQTWLIRLAVLSSYNIRHIQDSYWYSNHHHNRIMICHILQRRHL
jgi:hypothetical protein